MQYVKRAVVVAAGAALLFAAIADAQSQPSPARYLPKSKFTIASTISIDSVSGAARLPLRRGSFKGKAVYYVITDVSNERFARELGVNFAPRLAVITMGCPACAQVVHTSAAPLGRASVEFAGVPDFSPKRILVAGPKGFPPMKVQPGAKADLHYSPFVRIAGSNVIYNASIVATGDGPFDVRTHTNTADRVLAIDTRNMTVDLLVVRAFAYGKRILYLSSEASDPTAAAIERAIFVPALNGAPFAGGGAFPEKSARAEIFAVANGYVPNPSPPGQGFAHVILSGGNQQDASYSNTAVLSALREGGDAHNVLDNWPTVPDRALAEMYSPLWDLQIGMYTPHAVAAGLNRAHADANELRQLSARGALRAPGGVLPVSPVNIVVNCSALAFMDTNPTGPQVAKPPGQP